VLAFWTNRLTFANGGLCACIFITLERYFNKKDIIIEFLTLRLLGLGLRWGNPAAHQLRLHLVVGKSVQFELKSKHQGFLS
jgi:hypothetical protein